MKITDDMWAAAMEEYHASERYPTFSGWKNMRASLEAALTAAEADAFPGGVFEVDAHVSDCTTHNAPAYPAGDCDCGTARAPLSDEEGAEALLRAWYPGTTLAWVDLSLESKAEWLAAWHRGNELLALAASPTMTSLREWQARAEKAEAQIVKVAAEGTVRVRIPIVVDVEGSWAATALSTEQASDAENVRNLLSWDVTKEPSVVHWITADIPLPQPAEIKGVVSDE